MGDLGATQMTQFVPLPPYILWCRFANEDGTEYRLAVVALGWDEEEGIIPMVIAPFPRSPIRASDLQGYLGLVAPTLPDEEGTMVMAYLGDDDHRLHIEPAGYTVTTTGGWQKYVGVNYARDYSADKAWWRHSLKSTFQLEPKP